MIFGGESEQARMAGMVVVGAGGFDEVDLRRMLQHGSAYRPDVVESRWIVECRHAGRRWEVIVEPDRQTRLLVVVTAFPVWES